MFYRNEKSRGACLGFALASVLLWVGAIGAQTTSFTYQGRLTAGGSPASGNYDLQFALFDSSSGGTQVGSTQTLNLVAVSNGVFTVSLDFGANAFPGAARFLEIGARSSGGGSFTLLSPRQQITSTPYAVRSLNAASADNVTVNGNQAFSVSGVGTYANSNTFAGVGAGAVTIPDSNGFGSNNSFYGNRAGLNNTTGDYNSFFGVEAGRNNTTGTINSFFGAGAGFNNTTSRGNSFFGINSGGLNTTGDDNSFVGRAAGFSNTSGSRNTIIGSSANVAADNLVNATAIGANAVVAQSNSMVLGNNANVGIGTTAPVAKLDVRGSLVLEPGTSPAIFTSTAGTEQNRYLTLLNSPTLTSASGLKAGGVLVSDSYFYANPGKNDLIVKGSVGIGTATPAARLHVNGRIIFDDIGINGDASLCRNAAHEIALCGVSSFRYKNNVTTFYGGLDIVKRLRPIAFNWKQNGGKDIGFGAEEVAQVAPLLTFRNDQGGVEGVRYDRLNVILVNAVKEQQAQIETLQQVNSLLNARLHQVERVLRKKSKRRR